MCFSSGRARASALGAFVLLVLAGPSIAADKPAGQSDPIARHGFADSDVGYVLRDLKPGATIASHLPDRTFIPASVAKVGTSVAALETLGQETRDRKSAGRGKRVSVRLTSGGPRALQ